MICENDIDALLEQAGLVINAIQDHLRVKNDSGAEEILNKYLVFLINVVVALFWIRTLQQFPDCPECIWRHQVIGGFCF